jgi:hypothetical protein
MIDFSLKWFLTGGGFGLFIGILPYLFMNKKDRIDLSLKQMEYFRKYDDDIDNQFKNFKDILQKYINNIDKTKNKDINYFIDITNSFEKLMSSIENICIDKIENRITNNAFAKYFTTIKDIGDMRFIQFYYKIVNLNYKEEYYRNFYIVYGMIKCGVYHLPD